jgi:hypothetical protein
LTSNTPHLVLSVNRLPLGHIMAARFGLFGLPYSHSTSDQNPDPVIVTSWPSSKISESTDKSRVPPS